MRTLTDAPQLSHLAVALPDDDGDDEEKAEHKGTIMTSWMRQKTLLLKMIMLHPHNYLGILGP
jgi:hypothetical protein